MDERIFDWEDKLYCTIRKFDIKKQRRERSKKKPRRRRRQRRRRRRRRNWRRGSRGRGEWRVIQTFVFRVDLKVTGCDETQSRDDPNHISRDDDDDDEDDDDDN